MDSPWAEGLGVVDTEVVVGYRLTTCGAVPKLVWFQTSPPKVALMPNVPALPRDVGKVATPPLVRAVPSTFAD
jgi:hypothetical protein